MKQWTNNAIVGVFALSSVFLSTFADAGSLYRWVDKEGKVHYSQTAPVDAPVAETTINVQRPSADAEKNALMPEVERNERGECATIKCLADQMESDRLERERGYARQRAENERVAKKPVTVSNPQVSGAAIANPSLDKHLYDNCRNGLSYGSGPKVSCDNPAALREQWTKAQERAKRSYEENKNRDPYR